MADMHSEFVDNTIILTKVFDASKAVVFSMFKDPARLTAWWGPSDWPATTVAFTFAPEGAWQYYMTGPDGSKAWGKAVFTAIDEPNSLSFVDAFSDESGTINHDLPQGTVNFTFDEIDGRTTLKMVGEYASADEVAKLVEMGMIEGMTETWDHLERLITAAI